MNVGEEMRRPLLLALLILAVLPAGASAAAACTGDPAQQLPLDIPVNGQNAHGLYTLPSGPPRGLVVFGHGYGHLSDSWREHMSRTSKVDWATVAAESAAWGRERGIPVG